MMEEDLWGRNPGPQVEAALPAASIGVEASIVQAEAEIAGAAAAAGTATSAAVAAAAASEVVVPSKQCAICLGQMDAASRAVVEDCFHAFCQGCIVRWCEKQQKVAAAGSSSSSSACPPRCPLCREPIVTLLHDIQSDDTYTRSEPAALMHAAGIAAARSHRRAVQYDPLSVAAMQRRRTVYSQQLFSQRPWQRVNLTLPPGTLGTLAFPSGPALPLLLPWLRRELRALLRVDDVETVVQFVIGVCERLGIPPPSPREQIDVGNAAVLASVRAEAAHDWRYWRRRSQPVSNM